MKTSGEAVKCLQKMISELQSQLNGNISNSSNMPSGAIVAFDLTDCPNGWSEYALAYGRFIRGIDRSGAKIDPDGERARGNVQEDALQSHIHTRRYRIGGNTAGGGRNMEDNAANDTFRTGPPEEARTSTETRPKNVALLYCKKQ